MIDSRIRRNARLAIGLLLLALVCFAALFAPLLTPHSPFAQDLEARRAPPSLQHPFGLDEVGRDNLSRVLYGARMSLAIGIAAVALALVIGTGLGLAAGYRGGWLDSVTMSMMDVMLAFPTLLLAIVLITALGRGLPNVIYALAFAAVPTYTRLARVGVLAIKQKEYVVAAQAVGVSSARLFWRHMLPNCLVPLQAQASLGIGSVILEAAGLSFLGLGAQPPTPEGGAMIAQGRGAVFAAPHIVLFPGIALMLTVLGFNFVADGLQDLGAR